MAGVVPVAPAPAEPEPDEGLVAVTAPLVGTFYHAPEPGAEPFVAVGAEVAAGQQVGIVEAMKLMNPVVAVTPGRVARVVAADNEPVEYGQPLILLTPLAEG
ncbi:acetyl-CoA carboxylase biotin carboxyl carrier protein [Amycolatopsis sp. NPDC058986]|uniref:acetyl-CoA carboxylase biotin carboxyl carrier protein n=1 Tax=unclassified Amycolatopsis TaxID=2618356 RepID=UPI00367243AD